MQVHSDIRFQSLIERMEALHLEGCVDEMRPVLEKLRTLAESEQDDIGLAAAYFYQDALFAKDPSSEFYMQYVDRALKIAQAKNIPYYEMKASNSLGIITSELSDFHSSLEHYLRAIHIAELHPEYCYAAVALNNIGNLFVWLEDYPVAIGYLERAYHRSIVENKNDHQLIALIILNLIELYSYMEEYEKVDEWKVQSHGKLNDEAQSIVACIDTVNLARQLVRAGDTVGATEKLWVLQRRPFDSPDYIYTFRCHINALRLGILMDNFALCSGLMERMEKMQRESEISSFAYDFAAVRIEYYQAFPDQLMQRAHIYLEEYYRQSQSRIRQLRDTYARSLSVKIALEEMKDENKNVHLQNEQLQRDIERDIFTNLYNKVSTKKHVTAAMSARANDEIQALLLIDIDLFKSINDNYGHVFGDKVIAKVAGVLETLEEQNKIAGRFGGDEFLVFLGKQKSAEDIQRTAQEILERMHSCIQLPNTKVRKITASIGICVIDTKMKFNEAFVRADKALYRAKELGRNRYEIGKRK